MLRSFYTAPEKTQAVSWPWEDGWQEANRKGSRWGQESHREDQDGSRTDQVLAASLTPDPLPALGGAVQQGVPWWPGPRPYPLRPREEASSAWFLPLLTLSSEYRLVEFWNFPLDHGPEVLFQLVVVLLEFLLIFLLVCCDKTLVFLYSFTASEVQISGWGENEVLFHRSLKCLEIWNDDAINISWVVLGVFAKLMVYQDHLCSFSKRKSGPHHRLNESESLRGSTEESLFLKSHPGDIDALTCSVPGTTQGVSHSLSG